jgi:UDP-3-O-[3-hydroxymyristoyl] N-acetylglucosamine deacetylase
VIRGKGLHGGEEASVTFIRRPGPVTLNGAPLPLPVTGTERATTVRTPRGEVRTVEHLFAALGGLGVHHGLGIEVDGPELPLLDGGAARWAEEVAGVELATSRLTVAREGTIDHEGSRYELVPGDGVHLRVRVDFDDPRLALDAEWRGDAEDFRARIAPARTFAFAHEIEPLLEKGLASHVDPESVIVIAPGRIYAAGRAFVRDEPARHKLLDLLGDLYVYGGPPRGQVTALRPGHRATHAVMREAIARGLVV